MKNLNAQPKNISEYYSALGYVQNILHTQDHTTITGMMNWEQKLRHLARLQKQAKGEAEVNEAIREKRYITNKKKTIQNKLRKLDTIRRHLDAALKAESYYDAYWVTDVMAEEMQMLQAHIQFLKDNV
jgi:hypothetical protein